MFLVFIVYSFTSVHSFERIPAPRNDGTFPPRIFDRLTNLLSDKVLDDQDFTSDFWSIPMRYNFSQSGYASTCHSK